VTFFTAGLQPPMAKPAELMAAAAAPSEPVLVYTGPTKTGPALIAAVAAEAEKQASARRGKKSKVAAKKPDGAAPKVEAGAKPAAKPAAVKHASAKPEAAAKPAASAEKKPAGKPAAADKPAPKPAKPKAAAKPKGENKPAG
jgi:D-alanyl-D-alanine carboxypeptidase